MSPEVAVIPAAGRGTRMRPATRVVPKALLTVVDRPAIQYVVEEAVAGGARTVILVLDGDVADWVEGHFTVEGPLPGLEDIELQIVIQEDPLGLGHAVGITADAVGDRPFFCLLSDRIVRPGQEILKGLREGSGDGSVSVIGLRQLLDDTDLTTHGVAVPAAEVVDGFLDLAGGVEKPGAAEAPSRLIFDGRYLFTPEVFSILGGLQPGVGGEIQLTDAINTLGDRGRLRGFVADTDLLDVGTPAGLVAASAVLGAHLLEG